MKNLHEPIAGEEAKPADLNDKKWAQLNEKAVGIIRYRLIRVSTTMSPRNPELMFLEEN